MPESRKLEQQPTNLSTSRLSPSGPQSGVVSSSVRSRNRRPVGSIETAVDRVLENPGSTTGSTSASRIGGSSIGLNLDRGPGTTTLGQFLGDSWAQGWCSVQELATTFLSAGDDKRRGTKFAQSSWRDSPDHDPLAGSARARPRTWGPAPPSRKSGVGDAAPGLAPERKAALRAVRTASILESHDGVNGGLDTTGRHKRRSSDDSSQTNPQTEDSLVYIHHVQPEDTYAGLVLRYRCREDVFRRANRLWSGDSIQTRKWLALPIDACDVRGRPHETPPSHSPSGSNFAALANKRSQSGQPASNLESRGTPTGEDEAEMKKPPDEEEPWTHVRWVHLDSLPRPVQIGRVTKQSLGFFPPRRKKSIRTMSSLSTPRPSSELSVDTVGTAGYSSSRRQSDIGARPKSCGVSVPFHSRMGCEAADVRPSWMRRPGGVGSITTREPGPDSDYLNSWATRHLPSLNLGGLPSMSIMGSETASFGFTSDPPGIVESSFEEGRDTASLARQRSGLDKAAAAVESWLRVALTKRPSTPIVGSRAGQTGLSTLHGDGDLIELANTGLDDTGFNSDPTLLHKPISTSVKPNQQTDSDSRATNKNK
ncbi:hypothetical protein XA68_11039 [Ophiocordyceps unilateralis]|uniref:LysM domain-containing protein n=1 Tax=Ophiocordyceps unilateralis TaxID=268505 RepID=A0A2A9NYE3_OPHUN|nr:hypothetical protein XA68_11039 [Ophiocordyceps unilateralis]